MGNIVALLAALGALLTAMAPVASALMSVFIIVQQMRHGATLKQIQGGPNGTTPPPTH